jgi:biopolymer transport protein ExbD
MSMAVGKHQGGAKAEINITPLVDVVLVLLIIFLVISPGDSTYVPNAIPKKAELDNSVVLNNEQLVLQLFATGKVLLNNQEVNRQEFADRISQFMSSRADQKLFVSADDEIPYGEVVSWMGLATSKGVPTVAIQLKKPEQGATESATQ